MINKEFSVYNAHKFYILQLIKKISDMLIFCITMFKQMLMQIIVRNIHAFDYSFINTDDVQLVIAYNYNLPSILNYYRSVIMVEKRSMTSNKEYPLN